MNETAKNAKDAKGRFFDRQVERGIYRESNNSRGRKANEFLAFTAT